MAKTGQMKTATDFLTAFIANHEIFVIYGVYGMEGWGGVGMPLCML